MKPMSFARRRLALVVITALLPALTACGVFGDSSEENNAGQVPEKSTIKIGGLKLTDSIPMLLARDSGYFEDEGLQVEMEFGEKGSANLADVMDGKIDIGMSSYPPPINKQLEGSRLKVVAEAVLTTPGLIQIVVRGDSPLRSVNDLAGKRVANSSARGITELTLGVQLEMRGVDPRSVEFVSMEIAKMPDALARGEVDAAGIAEPYIQSAMLKGAIPLFDPFTGPTADFPWSGYVATEKFTDENPKTVAAFQRGLSRAVEEIRQDRSKAEKIATQYLEVDEAVASLMTLPEYPTNVDKVRLQRVADMLHQAGEIPDRIDMSDLVLSGGANEAS
jgi:NitT/TauT family transport system substrate-binding protein